jgi:hypothetical protein
MSKTTEKIAVMQAHAEGRPIECKPEGCPEWINTSDPVWNWQGCTYRIKLLEVYIVTATYKGQRVQQFSCSVKSLSDAWKHAYEYLSFYDLEDIQVRKC